MSFSTLALILVSVSLSAAAQILFKIGVSSATRARISLPMNLIETIILYLLTPGVVGGLALYGIGTLLWLQVLSKVDVSQAYPFVGVGFVLTAIFGAILFGENVTLVRLLGMVIVVVGIYLIARS